MLPPGLGSRSYWRFPHEECLTDGGPQPDVMDAIEESVKLSRDVTCHIARRGGKSLACTHKPANDKVATTLRRLVSDMLDRHKFLFNGMVQKLRISTRESGFQGFASVANEVLDQDDRKITWGRIVALYAFGAHMALMCRTLDLEDYTLDIAEFVGRYIGEKTFYWIQKQGGWESLCRDFPSEYDLDHTIRNVLMITGVILGATAAVLFTIRS